MDDLRERIRFVASMSDGRLQESLIDGAIELRRLRGEFSAAIGEPDEALRRRLQHIATTTRADVAHGQLLLTSFRRICAWSQTDLERSERGIGEFRSLAALQGRDDGILVDRIAAVLDDSAWQIATVRGEPRPEDPRATAGISGEARLSLMETLLEQPPARRPGVVWLEYLQARLGAPWVLPIGTRVTLYAHDFLRPTLHQAPNDPRIPDELREDSDVRPFLASWLGAYDASESVLADYEVYGDPRVFLRIELEEMPSTQLVPAARETAEFLVAYGALGSDDHDLWVLGESYHVVNGGSSTAWVPVNADKARDQLPHDDTAAALARTADLLAKHLPLRGRDLRVAGRLLVWLRQATRNDNPVRLVLCDRVVEQVAGWAGVARPSRFVTEFLRPGWVYEQVRRSVQQSYLQLMNDTHGAHALTSTIEEPPPRPPFSHATYLPSINLRAVLENLDALIEVAPRGSSAWTGLARLRARTATPRSVGGWLDQLEDEFEVRNDRLRRTRNALMHGGPLVRTTVDDVARFAETLAYQAIGPAVHLMLEEEDVIDGFLRRQQDHTRCFARLRHGSPPSEALFWN